MSDVWWKKKPIELQIKYLKNDFSWINLKEIKNNIIDFIFLNKLNSIESPLIAKNIAKPNRGFFKYFSNAYNKIHKSIKEERNMKKWKLLHILFMHDVYTINPGSNINLSVRSQNCRSNNKGTSLKKAK